MKNQCKYLTAAVEVSINGFTTTAATIGLSLKGTLLVLAFLAHTPHLVTPYGLWRVEFPEEDLGKLLGLVVLQVAHHGFRQYMTQHTAMHDVRR